MRSKDFRIHPHLAEKRGTLLLKGTFGHTVELLSFVCLKVHSEGEIADCPVAVRGVQDTNGAGIRGREASFLAWRGDHYLSTLVFGRGAH